MWRHGVQRVPFRYDPQFWALVFPLGMYSVATTKMITAVGLSFGAMDPSGGVLGGGDRLDDHVRRHARRGTSGDAVMPNRLRIIQRGAGFWRDAAPRLWSYEERS